MATTDAAFNSWEEALCKYIAFGGLSGYSDGLPGMVTSPSAPAFNAYVRLAKGDPRSSVVYPNAWVANANSTTSRGTLEPTVAEWSNYGSNTLNQCARTTFSIGELEVFNPSAGAWAIRTKTTKTLTWTAPLSGDTGCQLTHAVLCLPGFNAATGAAPLYALLVAELDSTLDAVASGTNLTIAGQTLVFSVR
jgi:hypothetical protein